jgi:uncharacterized protein (DUF2132 family)
MSANDPMHGMTLEKILIELEAQYGWDGLALRININCFKKDPSIKSSLKFLRRTPWARAKVEALFLDMKQGPWKSSKR